MKLPDLFGFRARTYAGDSKGRWPSLFGVELELEDPTVIQNTDYWVVKNDGSLRNGVEYILREPQGGDALAAAINEYYNLKCKFTNGPRTSTHIHVTAGDMTVENLRVMMVIMYTLEDGLFNVIGESRKWGGYSMALSEMDTVRLRTILSCDDAYQLTQQISPARNQERYYGLNIAVNKHGTVEFRYFPGGPSKSELESWIDFVSAIKQASLNTPLDMLLNIGNNVYELREYFRSILPEGWFDKLRIEDQSLDRFTEVIALCADPELFQRNSRLVFATKPLVSFIRNKIFPGAGKIEFDKLVKGGNVYGAEDWNMILRRSYDAELNDRRPKKTISEKPVFVAGHVERAQADGSRYRRLPDVVGQVAELNRLAQRVLEQNEMPIPRVRLNDPAQPRPAQARARAVPQPFPVQRPVRFFEEEAREPEQWINFGDNR